MIKRKTTTQLSDFFKGSGFDFLKIATLIFFGGVFYSQFSESQKSTDARFLEFKEAAIKRDERMEKMQDAQNTLVNQLVEIKGDMKGLALGVQDIKTTLSKK